LACILAVIDLDHVAYLMLDITSVKKLYSYDDTGPNYDHFRRDVN